MQRSDAPAWLLALALGASSIGCSSGFGLAKKSTPAAGTLAQAESAGPLKKVSSAFSNTGKSIAGVFQRDPSKKKPKTEPVDPVALKTKTKPPGADFYVMVAQLKERSGDLAVAEEQYQKALQTEKNYLPASLGLARLYDNQGQMQKATEVYQDAVKKHPKEASPHNDLGLCYARQSRYAEAAAELKRAIELQPDRALYHNNLATVLVELDRPQEALQQLMAGQKPAVAHFNLGYLLAKRGKNEAAAQQFASALEKDPGLDAARQSLDQLAVQSPNMNGPQMAMQEPPRSLPIQDQTQTTEVHVGPNPVAGPNHLIGPNRGTVIAADPVETLVPAVNEIARDTTPVQQSPASQVRPVRDLVPLAPLRTDSKAAPTSTELESIPAMPPTPDRLNDFSKSNVSKGDQARLQPLPPVEGAYYPPSRY